MKENIPLKTSIDVSHIRNSCRIIHDTFRLLKKYIRPGVRTAELDEIADDYIAEQGAVSAIQGYKGFPKSICTSVNNVAAHGIPGDYVLEDGDIISIDITVARNGWHGDGTWTYLVGNGSPDALRLLKAAWRASSAGIQAASAGAHLGDIGAAIAKGARANGCSVIRDYVGHGIGQGFHEDPLVPNYGKPNHGMRIVPGMVFTIEPIVCLGSHDVKTLEDGWTVVTADGAFCAQFEHTLAVFRDHVEVLTLCSSELDDYVDQPPFF